MGNGRTSLGVPASASPLPLCPHGTQRGKRVSQQHSACKFSFLYLVISNKRKVAVGRVSFLLCVVPSWVKAPGDSWWLC